MPVLDAPVTLLRVGGKWRPLRPTAAGVSNSFSDDADRPGLGEPAGHAGRLAYQKGHRYQITEATAAELAEVEAVTELPGNKRARVRLGDWVRPDPEPEPERPEEALLVPLWSAGQRAELDELRARLAVLEADREARET